MKTLIILELQSYVSGKASIFCLVKNSEHLNNLARLFKMKVEENCATP